MANICDYEIYTTNCCGSKDEVLKIQHNDETLVFYVTGLNLTRKTRELYEFVKGVVYSKRENMSFLNEPRIQYVEHTVHEFYPKWKFEKRGFQSMYAFETTNPIFVATANVGYFENCDNVSVDFKVRFATFVNFVVERTAYWQWIQSNGKNEFVVKTDMAETLLRYKLTTEPLSKEGNWQFVMTKGRYYLYCWMNS